MSLVILLVAILIIGGTAATMGKMLSTIMRSAVQDNRKRTATGAASGALMDYMRMFSNSYYEKHYDSLNRPAMTIGDGTVEYNPVAMESENSVYLESVGRFGDGLLPGSRQRYSALIRFQSDLTRYLVFIPSSFEVSASNIQYTGACVYKQDLKITGTSIVYNGGPLIVGKNLILQQNLMVKGDLYLGGTKSGPGTLTVQGRFYSFAPNIDLPEIDQNYYNAHYTTKTVTNVWWKFNADGTYNACQAPGLTLDDFNACAGKWSPAMAIPTTGAIFYGDNTNVGVFGTIARPVTIVTSANTYGTNAGVIVIPQDITYPVDGIGNPRHNATQDFAVAFLAKNRIRVMNWDGGETILHGVFYPEKGYMDPNACGIEAANGGGQLLRLWGSRFYGITMSGHSGASLNPDPELNRFPPPGLPKKPLLVNANSF